MHSPAPAGANAYLGLDPERRSHLFQDVFFILQVDVSGFARFSSEKSDCSSVNSSVLFLNILFLLLPLSLRLFIDTVASSLQYFIN